MGLHRPPLDFSAEHAVSPTRRSISASSVMWSPATEVGGSMFRSPDRSVPSPERQVYWNWLRGEPQAPAALSASPSTGRPLSTTRSRFWRTAATPRPSRTSRFHRPIVTRAELSDLAEFDAQTLQSVDDADQCRLVSDRSLQHRLGGLGDDS